MTINSNNGVSSVALNKGHHYLKVS